MLNLYRNVCALRCASSISVKQISATGTGERISGDRLFHLSDLKGWSEKRKPNPSEFHDRKTTPTGNPKVTLLTADLMPTVVTLEQARKIASHRNLKLVRVTNVDHKTQRPVYKLLTGAEYFEEDLSQRKEKILKKNAETKEPKLVQLSHRISDHDLASKIKNVIKWLNKRHEVRIGINAPDNMETAERIYSTIKTETNHAGKLVQKRIKGNDLKFQLMPLKKLKLDSDGSSVEESNDETAHRESP